MYSSFVVKLKNIGSEIEIKYPAKYFYELFLEGIKTLNKESFNVSKILGKKEELVILKEGESFFVRISSFSNEAFELISQEIFKYKLLSIPFFHFEILGFSGGDKGLWGKNIESINIEDKFSLDFYSPILFKFGDSFIEKFDKLLFLKSLEKKAGLLKKYSINKIADKIGIEARNERKVKVNYNKNFTFGIRGNIVFDIENLEYYEKEYLRQLIKIGYYTRSGYMNELGYGMYSIGGIDEGSSI